MLDNLWITLVMLAFLMYLDFFLTLKGYVLSKKKYRKHIEAESYELNPAFRKAVNKAKYNWKHTLGVILYCVLVTIIYFSAKSAGTMTVFYFIQGYLLTSFVIVNANHIQNIILFKSLLKHPKMLSGKVKQSLEFSLTATGIRYLGLFILLIFLFAFLPSAFMLGAAAGPLRIFIAMMAWRKKARKKKK